MIRIRDQKSIGNCMVSHEGRKIILEKGKKKKSKTFGFIIKFEIDRSIKDFGGVLKINWRWSPEMVNVNLEGGIAVVSNRQGSPWKINLPKMSPGVDSRLVEVRAEWDEKIFEKLENNAYSFDFEFEIAPIPKSPIILGSGRGMRNDTTINRVGVIEEINSLDYVPIEVTDILDKYYVRRFADGSIHIDNTGPYFYEKITSFDLGSPIGKILFYSKSKDKIKDEPKFEENSQNQLWKISKLLKDVDKIAIIKGAEKRKMIRILKKDLDDIKKDLDDKSFLLSRSYSIKIGETNHAETISSSVQSLLSILFIKSGILLGDDNIANIGKDNIQNLVKNKSMKGKFNSINYFKEYDKENKFISIGSQLLVMMAAKFANLWANKEENPIEKFSIDLVKIFSYFDLSNNMAKNLNHFFELQRPEVSTPQYISTQLMILEFLIGESKNNQLKRIRHILEDYLTGLN